MKIIICSIILATSVAFAGMNEVKKEIETLLPNATKSVKEKCGCLPKVEVKYNTFNTADLLTCAKNRVNDFASDASGICDNESKKIDFCKVKTWSYEGTTKAKPQMRYANGVATLEIFHFNNTNCQGDTPVRFVDDQFEEERKVREMTQELDTYLPVSTKSIKEKCGCEPKIEVKKNTFTSGLLMGCARSAVKNLPDYASNVCIDQGNKTGFCKVKTWLFTGTKGEPTMKFANGVGHLEVGLSAENCRTWTAEDLVKEHVKN